MYPAKRKPWLQKDYRNAIQVALSLRGLVGLRRGWVRRSHANFPSSLFATDDIGEARSGELRKAKSSRKHAQSTHSLREQQLY